MSKVTSIFFKGIAGMAVVWLIFATIYRTTYLSGTSGFLLYFGLPVFVGFLAVAALLLTDDKRINVFLAVVSTLFSIYIVELGLDFPILINPMNQAEAARKAGIPFDERSVASLIVEDRAKGEKVYPSICPATIMDMQQNGSIQQLPILPLGGMSNTKTYLGGNESGTWHSFMSDSHGFRNPADMFNSVKVEIAMLGDSFAQGGYVADGGDIASFLREAYPETLNLACSGNGPMLEYAAIREYLSKIKPKMVLWFYFEGNDLGDIALREQFDPTLKKYYESDFLQSLMSRQVEVDEMEKRLADSLLVSPMHVSPPNKFTVFLKTLAKLGTIRVKLGLVGSSLDIGKNRNEFAIFANIIKKSHAEVTAWGGGLYFVYLPQFERYDNPYSASLYRDEVLKLMREEHISVIDMHPIFSEQKDPRRLFPFSMKGHYSTEGYRIVASEIVKTIQANPIK